ncbi:MAG: phage minor capsid protein [Clostridia bacterium]|nr:phage minor capsid protein [Clostridia bacterium]
MARQNILYGTRETIKAYNDELGEELGCDGIEISFNSTCRPSHQFMEGKQYEFFEKPQDISGDISKVQTNDGFDWS